jgi:hypothetical protein
LASTKAEQEIVGYTLTFMLEEVVVRTAGGSGLWPMAGTGINKVEHLHSAT